MNALLLLAQLVVVCDPADSYRSVAEQIAREESIKVSDSWTAVSGDYLVWVVEPSRMSDRVLVQFARDWRDRFPEVATGVITGRNAEQALALWRRGRVVRGDRTESFVAWEPLDRDRFLNGLQNNDYVSFYGHGGQTYLRLSPTDQLRAQDLPPLRNLVIGTQSCNVFRPWAQDSIALAFIERGAAGFAGFAYSPENGFLIGGEMGMPFRYTSPEFPIGRVVQVQNAAAMRAIAAIPMYFLMGDPRMHLRAAPVSLADAPRGFIPVRLRGGAGSEVVRSGGVASAKGHGFYNSRLEAIDAGSDKYVLVEHPGGPLDLQTERTTAWWRPLRQRAVDTLDNSLVFFSSTAVNCATVLLVGGVALVVALRRKRLNTRAIAAGAILAVLHLLWALVRSDHVTVISKKVGVHPLAIVATFVCCTAAAMLFRRSPIAALAVATFASWFPAALHFTFTFGSNLTVYRPHTGESIYGHQMAGLVASGFPIVLGVVAAVFTAVCRADRAQSLRARTASHSR